MKSMILACNILDMSGTVMRTIVRKFVELLALHGNVKFIVISVYGNVIYLLRM